MTVQIVGFGLIDLELANDFVPFYLIGSDTELLGCIEKLAWNLYLDLQELDEGEGVAGARAMSSVQHLLKDLSLRSIVVVVDWQPA